jgi:hypothetical protein
MEKVVPLFKSFKTIFCFKFFDLKKVRFGSAKVWKNLKLFELFKFWIGFKHVWLRVATVQWDPPVSPLSPLSWALHVIAPPAPTACGLTPPVVTDRGPPPLGTSRPGPPPPPFSSASFKRWFLHHRRPFSSPCPISLDKSRATLHGASTLPLVRHHQRSVTGADGIEATAVDVFGWASFFPQFFNPFAAAIHASCATGASGAGLQRLLLPKPSTPPEHHRPPPHRCLTAATPPQWVPPPTTMFGASAPRRWCPTTTPIGPSHHRWSRHGRRTTRTVWQPDWAAVASLVSPFGPLGMAGRNSRKAEALGRNRTFTVHAFFYFQKIDFCLKF